MVSQITRGSHFSRNGLPFRRRNARPAGYALGAAALSTAVLWAVVLTRPPHVHDVNTCNPPPAADEHSGLGAPMTAAGMTDTTPMKPAETKVRILNASGVAGQAADIADTLRDLGFAQADAGNDPVYAGTRLTCAGQIRFGEAGRRAAATVWLVAPCAEFYRDERADDSVDLAVGTEFSSSHAAGDITTVLAALNADATPDPGALKQIRSAPC